MQKILRFLDEEGFFAAALLGVISLLSLPITIGTPQFELSTLGAVISLAFLLLVSVARLLTWMLLGSSER